MSELAPFAIAVPILVACVLLAVGKVAPRVVVDGIAIAAAASVLVLDVLLLAATSGSRVVTWAGGWRPTGGITFGIVLVADPVGVGLAIVAAVLVAAALVFSTRYYEAQEAHLHALLLLFLTGMTGFCLTGDLFDMLVFFELMGAAAYALTAFVIEDRTAVHGALNFGIVNSLGAYVTLFGVALLYGRTGRLGLAQLAVALAGKPTRCAARRGVRAHLHRLAGEGRRRPVPLLDRGRRGRRSEPRLRRALRGHGGPRALRGRPPVLDGLRRHPRPGRGAAGAVPARRADVPRRFRDVPAAAQLQAPSRLFDHRARGAAAGR